MKRVFAVLAVLAASAAMADVISTTPTATAYVLKRGTSNVADALSPADCIIKANEDTEKRKVGANYSCVGTSKWTTTYKAPTCPAKPANQTQTAQCGAPLVGSWPQTASYTTAPYPTCWVLGAWSPASAPAGACTSPPASGTWTRIADENQPFTVGTNQTVRFGRNGPYIQKVMSGAGQCTFDFFGGDPSPGEGKFCDVLDGSGTPTPPVVTPPPPSASGTAQLDWQPPTTNADGTALTDLAGYRIEWGTAAGVYSNAMVNLPADVRTYTFTGLTVGTYYFIVRAVDTSGNASAPSSELKKTVQ